MIYKEYYCECERWVFMYGYDEKNEVNRLPEYIIEGKNCKFCGSKLKEEKIIYGDKKWLDIKLNGEVSILLL